MQNLDSIFLDRLEIKGREKPKLWYTPGRDYVSLSDITEDKIYLKTINGFKFDIDRDSKNYDQVIFWPNKDCSDWNNWRKYLFENKVDFIAPMSYIMSEGTNHIHLTQTICKLPYLLVEVESGKVIDALGNILNVDINKYRFASQSEIDGFFDVANNCGCVVFVWSKSAKTYDWYYVVHNKKPKFLPGDLVAIKDYITGFIFEGYYIVSDIIDCGKGITRTFKYKLISDSYYSARLVEVIMDEDKLVKCNVSIGEEKPETKTQVKTIEEENPKDNEKEESNKTDNYFLL